MDIGTPATEQDAQVPRCPSWVGTATFATLVLVVFAIYDVDELLFCLLAGSFRHGGVVEISWSVISECRMSTGCGKRLGQIIAMVGFVGWRLLSFPWILLVDI